MPPKYAPWQAAVLPLMHQDYPHLQHPRGFSRRKQRQGPSASARSARPIPCPGENGTGFSLVNRSWRQDPNTRCRYCNVFTVNIAAAIHSGDLDQCGYGTFQIAKPYYAAAPPAYYFNQDIEKLTPSSETSNISILSAFELGPFQQIIKWHFCSCPEPAGQLQLSISLGPSSMVSVLTLTFSFPAESHLITLIT